MVHLIIKWLVIALSLVFLANLLPGIYVESFGIALLAGLVMGLVNGILGPVLKLVTLPLTVLTFGLFVFIVNAVLFWLASLLVPGFEVHGFLTALLGSLFLTVIHALLEWAFGGVFRTT